MTSSSSSSTLLPLYVPYCGGLLQREALGLALGQFEQGSWQGIRRIGGGRSHGYRLAWRGGLAPLDLLSCHLSFPAPAGLSYGFELPAHQLVVWLLEAQQQGAQPDQDLPLSFWRWLLIGDQSGLSRPGCA